MYPNVPRLQYSWCRHENTMKNKLIVLEANFQTNQIIQHAGIAYVLLFRISMWFCV